MKTSYLLTLKFTNKSGNFDMIEEYHTSKDGAEQKIKYMQRIHGNNVKANLKLITFYGEVKTERQIGG